MALLRHRRIIGPSFPYISTPASAVAAETAEVQQFLDRVATPDTTHKNAYRTMINGLVADGVWALTDGLWILAAAIAATAKTNLKSSSFGLTEIVGPTFSADHGYTGDGSSSWLDTNFNPSTASGIYVQDSAAIMCYGLTEDSGGFHSAIGGNPPGTLICPSFAGSVFTNVNSGGGASGTNSTCIAAFVASRTGATTSAVYKNGSSIALGTDVTASTSMTANNITICGNAGGQLYNGQIAAGWIGGGLDGTHAAALMNRVNTYMASLTVPVNVY